MGTVHLYSILVLFLFCYFDGGNEVLAQKKKCSDICDESVDDDGDSYEDDEPNARDKVVEDLLSQIKKLEENVKSLRNTYKDLQIALKKCLDQFGPKTPRAKIFGLDLCYITPEGCSSDYDDDPEQEQEGNREKYLNSLREQIRKLEKKKEKLEEKVKFFKNVLDKCQQGKSKKHKSTTTTTTTTPKPKQKKYIIRTKKVSWYEAVKLCKNERKQIATIKSQSDQDALARARKDQGVSSGQLWVGGRRNSPGEEFIWRGQNPTAFTYTNWHSTEPSHWSDDDQNCVESSWEANKYAWFVYECDTEYNYACEYY